jgi:uncharacterized RDD family membrane protein YckC/predicted Ser/Thr protein kinase
MQRRSPNDAGATVAQSGDEAAATLPFDGGAPASSPTRGAGAATDSLCGSTLHHFRVDTLIGQGGMGRVYRGHDLALDRPVAVKIVESEAAPDESTLQRFTREARAQARLNHANVVQIYYIGEQAGLSFFAMELVEGESLEAVLVRGERLGWERAVELMIAVARALELGHRHGIVHRDIKPSNLLVDRGGEVKVADFGLAKWVQGDSSITQEGNVIGTPLYMSPEQAQGERTDHRSDIYSLGATFYHLLTGAPPFTAPTPIGIIAKQITQPVPRLRSANPGVPAPLAALIERCMAKDPAARFADYESLIAALVACRPQRRVPAGLWVRAAALFLDLLLLVPVLVVVGSKVANAAALALIPLYFCVGWLRAGQTVGMWAFKVRLRSLDDRPLGPAATIRRFLVFSAAFWISVGIEVLLTLFGPPDGAPADKLLEGVQLIAMLLAAAVVFGPMPFRRDRRGLHDLAARSYVYYRLDG